jgi:large-conductance mechanosensitive channel
MSLDKVQFLSQIKEFITNNNVVGTTAGVCVALFTKGLITSLVNDVASPALQLLFIKLNFKPAMKLFPKKLTFNFGNFFQQLTGWLIGLIVTFFFISFSFKYLFGIDGSKKNVATSTTKNSNKNDKLSNTNNIIDKTTGDST